MLKIAFFNLLGEYTTSLDKTHQLWQEIVNRHSEPHRYYHNLSHLTHILQQLSDIKSKLDNTQAIFLSLFYHDIVYDPTKQDNEAQSALLLEDRLNSISISPQIIEQCKTIILATKSHEKSSSSDCNYFTDADLAILGSTWDSYAAYTQQIRQEYSLYDNRAYNAGRKKVLTHFLDMPRIFKTDWFYNKLESQSRLNIQKEWRSL